MSHSPVTPTRFCVLVPVKPVAQAKSRLSPLGDEARRALVEAFAVDTVTAALGSPLVAAVVVVTDDHRLAAAMRAVGAHVLPDGLADDLNGSLAQAAAEARRRWPDLGVAALCADLPALRSDDLTRALTAAAAHPSSFVPDLEGGGTTMVAVLPGEDFLPSFGPGSRDAHAAAGAHELREDATESLRHDVDTPEDLRTVRRLGLGTRTSSVTTTLRL